MRVCVCVCVCKCMYVCGGEGGDVSGRCTQGFAGAFDAAICILVAFIAFALCDGVGLFQGLITTAKNLVLTTAQIKGKKDRNINSN